MMPASVVKSKQDERYWRQCKASVPANTKNRWARVMSCFMRRKAHAGRKKSWADDKRINPTKGNK